MANRSAELRSAMLALAALPLCSALGCGCHHVTPRAESVRMIEMSTSGLESVAAQTQNGDIEFLPLEDDSQTIQVRAVIHAWAATDDEARQLAESLEILTPLSDDGTQQQFAWNPPDQTGSPVAVEVSFEVRLPSDLRIEGQSYNGSLTAKGAHAACAFETTNGHIQVEDSPGDCTLISTNGPIEVQAQMENCDAESTNGSIEISGATGTLRATTTNGKLKVKSPAARVDLQCENGRITAKLHHASPRGTIETTNGGIDVDLLEGAEVELICRSRNGHIYCDLPDEHKTSQGSYTRMGVEGEAVSYEHGNPVAPLRINTTNGPIRIKLRLDAWEAEDMIESEASQPVEAPLPSGEIPLGDPPASDKEKMPETPIEEQPKAEAAEQPDTTHEPAADDQPATDDDAAATHEPAADDQPAPVEEPESAEEPPAAEESALDDKPAATHEPAADDQPATDDDPATDEDAATDDTAATTEEPAPVEEPESIEEPEADEKPAAEEEPASPQV
jgi:hypothetical protein